ncbi:hypothetical protein [Pseudomonas grimontii]|nr:putative ester cyclase [Pseudomonas grimontii]
MTRNELSDLSLGYIDCLNQQDWNRLGDFVHPDVSYNAKAAIEQQLAV